MWLVLTDMSVCNSEPLLHLYWCTFTTLSLWKILITCFAGHQVLACKAQHTFLFINSNDIDHKNRDLINTVFCMLMLVPWHTINFISLLVLTFPVLKLLGSSFYCFPEIVFAWIVFYSQLHLSMINNNFL